MSSGGALRTAAAATVVITVPVVAWWLLGDQSTDDGPNADRVLRLWPPLADHAVLLGSVATLLLIAAIAVLVAAHRQRPIARLRVVALVLAAGAGGVVALGYRTLTAGVVGANIGAGLMVFFGAPLAGVLAIGAVVFALRGRGQMGDDSTFRA